MHVVVGGLTRHLLGGGKQRPHVDVEPTEKGSDSADVPDLVVMLTRLA